MIPDDAVEAAAKLLYGRMEGPCDEWENTDKTTRRAFRNDVRATLEAAAPRMLAEAKAGALEEAAQDFEDNIGVGEFDELARRDGARWTHIDDAWEYQGPYMDWLRARAADLRKP